MRACFNYIVKVATSLWSRISPGTKRAIQLAVIGLVVGLVSVCFHYAVEWLFEHTIERAAQLGTATFVTVGFISVVGCSLLASLLIHTFEPSAGGGGVMPTKLAFWRDFGVIPMRTAAVKFVGSALTLGGGVSMGPEGPAVQIGAASASALGGLLGVAKQERRILCASGAAAAIAAAFNAPLAAILFILEEIIGDLNSRMIAGILVTAVMGALVAHALIGPQPAYQVALLGEATWRAALLSVLVAVTATLAGVCFQKGSMRLRRKMKTPGSRIPAWLKPCLGAFVSWAIATAVFLACGQLGVFGIGYKDVTQAISGSLPLYSALLLFIGKLCATLFAVGAGGCGGIFAPSFFIGAMSGASIVALAGHFLPLSQSDSAMLVMVGMCACLGAVIRAPLTCVLLIFEVTHQFSIIPLVLIATLISQLLARRLHHEGMYEEMLLQDGQNPDRILPPRDYKRWKEMHVGTIAQYQVAASKSLDRAELQALLNTFPYAHFPFVDGSGQAQGILARKEVEESLRTGTKPPLHPIKWVPASLTLAKAQEQMIETSENFLCVGNAESKTVEGIITLHDFLRAQQRLGDDASS